MLTADGLGILNLVQVEPAAAATGEVVTAFEGDESGISKATVTEVQRLRAMVDAINELGAVQPQVTAGLLHTLGYVLKHCVQYIWAVRPQ